MALPSNRIKKVKLNGSTTYEIVPESLAKNGHQASLPNLSADATLATTADLAAKQDTLVSGTNIKTINSQSILGSGDLEISQGTVLTFNTSDATEETMGGFSGYTWNITQEQLDTLADDTVSSVTVEIISPETAEISTHIFYCRNACVSSDAYSAAFFSFLDSSSANADVIGVATRLFAAVVLGQPILRLDSLGEIAPNPVKTINSTAPTEGNISLKTINGNEIVGSGNITIADNNQTIKGNGTAFNANDAINIVGSGATTVTADTTNKKITISTPAVTDHNQTVKGNGTAFGADAAINIVGGGATTVTADTTNSKITISTPAVTDTNQKVKAGSVTFDANDTVNFEGSGIVSVTGDATNDKITISASHQSIKTLDTTATTAQSTSASEAIAGSGKVTLHKVAKTGTYSDLIGTPSLATVATSGSYNDLSDKPVDEITKLTDAGSTTAGTWVATADGITAYVDGQLFAYKVEIAGASTTTLNINGLGAKTIYRYGTTKLTTQYGVGQFVLLAYNSTNDCFMIVSDYDANSDSKVRQYQAGSNAAGSGTKYPILTRYALTNKYNSYDANYSRFHTNVTVDTADGTLNAPTLQEGGTALSNKYQAKDADLTAIAGLSDSSTGFLKKTAANTWTLATPTVYDYATKAEIDAIFE